jgi:hypothetical protein
MLRNIILFSYNARRTTTVSRGQDNLRNHLLTWGAERHRNASGKSEHG